MMTDKNLLMIAYFFPPLGGAGSLRPLKLAKYLPEFGWKPIVLTVRNPDWYYAQDPALLDELPKDILVFRTNMIRAAWVYRILNPLRLSGADRWIRRWLLHPDPQAGWIPSALACGEYLFRHYNIKAIYSTSAPLSCHLAAGLIKYKTRLPWIAEFRDEWFENPDTPYPTHWHKRWHFRMEKKIVRYADHVMAVAPGFCELLKKHDSTPNKITTTLMGFDPDDFKTDKAPLKPYKKAGKFTIAFSGLFYGSFPPTRFLNAVSSLIDEKRISSKNIQILFVGANSPQESRFKDIHGISTFTGFVSHKQSIDIIRSCDALLLLLSKERGGFVIPSKTYEYMAAGRPILALVPPEGEAASLIRKTNTGVVADFEDTEAIKSAFMQLYNDWAHQNISLTPDPHQIEQFNQRRLIRGVADLLNQIAG